MKFDDLLDFAAKNSLDDAKTAVQALKEAIKREEMTTKAGNEQAVKACLMMVEKGNSQSQREAAVVLATYDIGRTNAEWQEVLQGAMRAFASIKEKDADAPLAKSIRYLVSKGVYACPDEAAAVAHAFCEKPEFKGNTSAYDKAT